MIRYQITCGDPAYQDTIKTKVYKESHLLRMQAHLQNDIFEFV